MGSTLLGGYETNLRNDLKDLDSSNYLWTNAELDRHVAHAVNDYSRVNPLVTSVTQTVIADAQGHTYRQQITPIPAAYLYVIRVEYPIDNNPPAYLSFWEEVPGGGSVYMPVGDPPVAGQSIKFWCATLHSVTSNFSSILSEHEEFIELGAKAYALQAATRYAQNRLNASYWTPKGIAAFAKEVMAEYQARLVEMRTANEWTGRGVVQWGDVPDDWQEL